MAGSLCAPIISTSSDTATTAPPRIYNTNGSIARRAVDRNLSDLSDIYELADDDEAQALRYAPQHHPWTGSISSRLHVHPLHSNVVRTGPRKSGRRCFSCHHHHHHR
jgi:hypothetical protein